MVLFRVVIHNVIVETEDVLGSLKCCYNDHHVGKREIQMV